MYYERLKRTEWHEAKTQHLTTRSQNVISGMEADETDTQDATREKTVLIHRRRMHLAIRILGTDSYKTRDLTHAWNEHHSITASSELFCRTWTKRRVKTNKNANITQIRAHSLQTSHKVEAYDRCIYTSVLAEMAHGAHLAQKPMARARGKRRPYERVHGIPEWRRSCDRRP